MDEDDQGRTQVELAGDVTPAAQILPGSAPDDPISLGWQTVVAPRTRRRKAARQIRNPYPEIVRMEMDLDNAGSYTALIDNLRRHLSEHPDARLVHGRALLAQLRPRYPARWMHVKLLSGGHETTLAIRDDNVYLMGFQAGNETWYEFGHLGRSARLIHGSTFLECHEDYRSILGLGGARKLMQLKLGKVFADYAVRALSGYQHDVRHGVDDHTKEALAGLIVIISESARMAPHYNTVGNAWLHPVGGSIDRLQVNYLWNWGNMSRFLIQSELEETHHVDLRGIGTMTTEGARRVVHLLLNTPEPAETSAASQSQTPTQSPAADRQPSTPARNRQHQQQQPTASTGNRQLQQPTASTTGNRQCQQQSLSPAGNDRRHHTQQQKSPPGRPLVELFSVRVNFPVVGTIDVFDGHRGQIIFICEEGQRNAHIGKDFIDLVLTGPYKAISADGGTFAIKIDPGDSSEDSIVPVVDSDTLWELDCVPDDDDDDGDGNSVIESTITIGQGSTAEVTYAVLSNAVEATVGVTLVLSGDMTHGTTHIHGKITTCLPLFHHDDDASVLLFSREREKKLVVPTAGSIHIPLARSILAMPIGSPLSMKVSLHTTTLIHDHEGTGSTTPVEGHFEHSLDLHMGKVQSTSVEGIGELHIYVNVANDEYEEGIMSNYSQEIDKKIEKKKGVARNKWMRVPEIFNKWFDSVKSRVSR